VTAAQRIEWLGEFALTLMTYGFLFIIIRMMDGPSHRPVLLLPLAWRWALLLAVAAVITTARLRLRNRKKRR
jgi:hypothetical protein